jgi:hypothetical protein
LKKDRKRQINKAPTTVAGLALRVGAAMLLVQLLLVLFVSGTPLLLHVSLMSMVIGSTAFLGDEQGRFDIRQPWSALMVFHAPFWVIGSFKTTLDPEQRIGWIPGAEAQMPLALLLISSGFVCIAFGYRFGVTLLRRPRELGQLPQVWNCSWIVLIATVAYLVVIPVRYYFYQEFLSRTYSEIMATGAPPAFVRTFDSLVPRFLLIVVWAAFYSNPSQRQLLWLGMGLTAAEMVWAVIVGTSKSAFFLPVFLPVIPYLILKRRIPVARVALSAAILLLVAYPFVNALRGEYFQLNGPRRAEAREAAFAHGWFWSSPTREGMEVFANQALDRVGGIGSVCQILQLDKDGDLDIRGTFYYRAILGLVPRVLWRNKPIIHEGVYFSAYLQGYRGLDTIDTSTISGSVALTLFGSFYWNFGWPGVLLTSLALGVFSGLAYRHLKMKTFADPAAFFYYSAILAVLETTETEIVKLPSSLGWGLILAWCASRLVGASVASKASAGNANSRSGVRHKIRERRRRTFHGQNELAGAAPEREAPGDGLPPQSGR